MYFGSGLMTVVAVTAITLNFKLIKKNRKINEDNKNLKDAINYSTSALAACALSKLELQQFPNTETFMEDRSEPIPHFAVYRQGLTEKIDLLHIGYKTDDPDDREYKRIFAQERVDALNEKP